MVDMTRPASLLVVDDDKTQRIMMTRLLVAMGHTVEVAEDGMEALEMLAATRYDAVLLDIVMPRLNGRQTLERILTDEALKDIPVIMVSGLSEETTLIECIQRGAADHITKPVNPTLLRARLDACLSQRKVEQARLEAAERVEEERKRHQALIEELIPPPFSAEWLSLGEVRPRTLDDIAIVVCDVAGFTDHCQTGDPAIAVQQLARLMSAMQPAMDSFNLLKLKSSGDTLMAVANLTTPTPEPLAAAVRGGLEMVRRGKLTAPEWRLRLGVDVGRVVSGVADSHPPRFDVWGAPVARAARTATLGGPGVHVPADTFETIADRCDGESIPPVELPGREPLHLVRITEWRQ